MIISYSIKHHVYHKSINLSHIGTSYNNNLPMITSFSICFLAKFSPSYPNQVSIILQFSWISGKAGGAKPGTNEVNTGRNSRRSDS